ncbi:MAG: sugar phosphate isomerase/epimerase [Caldilineaceae bacterium SB0662_bin_9]|uniref:Sugar phosphate isomerase/epimerase n=1 Tax=Caldilineaceae bacterium SB0662_bin_9 TaxID=2605258 RepID=A0A6B1DVB4_9CHLR|nr:sugar phosphate isomerase/epimerase [Caldilineaceae bacterium SB0662_bin_9]
MKGLSCNSALFAHIDVVECMGILADHGFQAIDVSLELEPPFLPVPKPHMYVDADAAERARVVQGAKAAGLDFGTCNAHTNLIDGDPEARARNLDFVLGGMRLAADLGCQYVITGGGMKNMYGREGTYWQRLLDAMAVILPAGEELGVTLLLECASLPGCLVHDLRGMRRLFAEDGMDSLQVLFDPAHYLVRGDDVTAAYRELAPRVRHIHAKDALGRVEDFEFPPLGEGEIDFRSLIQAVHDTGFAGYIALEYEGFAWGHTPDPLRILREGRDFLLAHLEATAG